MLSTIRHQSIFNPAQHGGIPIHIIGVGATGSHLAMSLAELGLRNVHCYDYDHVEAHNLANQAYEADHVGQQKVDALKQLVTAKLGYNPEGWSFTNDKVTSAETMTGIVFLLTDTMASRAEIGPTLTNAVYVIETRMASSYGNIFGFVPDDIEKWVATLTNDEDAEVSACGTSISVGPTAKILANLAAWHMINFITCPQAVNPRTNFYLQPLLIAEEQLVPVLGDAA